MPQDSDLIFWSTFEFYAPKLSAAAPLPLRSLRELIAFGGESRGGDGGGGRPLLWTLFAAAAVDIVLRSRYAKLNIGSRRSRRARRIYKMGILYPTPSIELTKPMVFQVNTTHNLLKIVRALHTMKQNEPIFPSPELGDETCKGASNLNLQLPAVTDGGGGGGRLTKWGINFQLNFPLKVLEKRERWGQQQLNGEQT